MVVLNCVSIEKSIKMHLKRQVFFATNQFLWEDYATIKFKVQTTALVKFSGTIQTFGEIW
jgi:hypothetical protein